MTSKIPKVTKTSTSAQAHLLPSTSFVAVATLSEIESHISLMYSSPATSNSMCTSVPSSLSINALLLSTGSMFSSLPAETSLSLKLQLRPISYLLYIRHPLPHPTPMFKPLLHLQHIIQNKTQKQEQEKEKNT
ncbi:hypothetical protein TNCV_2911751 [Trichonephila clavipes]|nr:hypothetical protein TNCV_2911751 [Trichonephila clavipes]